MSGEPVDEGVTALLARLATERTEFERTSAQPNDMEWLGRRFELMFDADQALRAAYVDSLDGGQRGATERLGIHIKERDLAHQRWLAGWLDAHAWPRRSTFGKPACRHAWMIVLHADSNPNLMRQVLKAMTLLLEEGEVESVHYAALFDRLEIVEGRPQRFGMFYRVVDGQRVSYPTADPERLAERRVGMDLGTTTFRR